MMYPLRMRRFCAAGLCSIGILFYLVVVSNTPAFAKTKKKKAKLRINAQSAIVVDLATDKIIFAKKIHTRRQPASTVKLLTALLAIDTLGPNGKVIISRNANETEPTKIWLHPGATYLSLDLIRAALISSANDACVALAEAVAGSESAFCDLLNKKARRLGAKNTLFRTASGLPAKGQYTTAYDLYCIAKAVLKNPMLYNVMKTQKCTIRGTRGNPIELVNHNKLVFKKNSHRVLVKTGYTKEALHCYAGVAYLNGRQYAIVILKSKRPWRDIENLIELIKRKT